MKKYKKIDYILNLILIISILFFVLILTRGQYLYGSKKDWITQHYAFADYFRKLFYYDYNIFPQFALNIGAGENIYYYSYYGLFSPIIIIAYFIPFVSMRSYIIVAMIIELIICVMLFYKWIYGKYGTKIAFISAFLFETASPLIFHSHRHIMFIDYLPFVILALIGVELFFEKRKRGLLIFSVIMIILSSFYYSIPAIIIITLYAINYWIYNTKSLDNKTESISSNNNNILQFVKAGISYALNIITAIMLCGFLLLPTMFALINGRPESSKEMTLFKSLIPNFNTNFFFYWHYSMGLSALFLVVLIYNAFYKKGGKRFLGISLLLINYVGIFSYVLNGMMYMDGKVFIPFLPVGVYLVASFLNDFEKNVFNDKIKKISIYSLIAVVPIIVEIDIIDIAFVVDLLATICILVYSVHKNKKKLFEISMCLISFCICVGINFADEFVNASQTYIQKENTYNKSIEKINEEDSLYRNNVGRISVSEYEAMNYVFNINHFNSSVYSSAFNQNFGKFYSDIIKNEESYRNGLIKANSHNLLYNMYMGNKYILGEGIDSKGYIEKESGIYVNTKANDFAFAGKHIVKKSDFDKLSYPFDVICVFDSFVIEDENILDKYKVEEISNSTIKNSYDINEWNIGNISNYDSKGYISGDEVYNVNFRKDKNDKTEERKYFEIEVPVPKPLQNKLFFISMDIDNSQYKNDYYITKDIIVKINGIANKLTDPEWKYCNNNYCFEYTISSNDLIKTLKLEFSDGSYLIKNFKIWTMDYEKLSNSNNTKVGINVCKDKSILEGEVECKDNELLEITIPFDDGFELYVDDKKTQIIKIDDTFIGCELSKGEHTFKLKFIAPGFKMGCIISIFGIILMSGIFITEEISIRKCNRNVKEL